MQSLLEKVITAATVGLWPPVPPALRSDYVSAPADIQAKMHAKYYAQQLRWARILGVFAMIMMIKWVWEFGFLAILGLGSGVATGADIGRLQQTQMLARNQAESARREIRTFINRYDRDILEGRLRLNDQETYQVRTAIAAAHREGRSPDPIHERRLVDLQSEKESLVRQLETLSSYPRAEAEPER